MKVCEIKLFNNCKILKNIIGNFNQILIFTLKSDKLNKILTPCDLYFFQYI